MLYYGLFIFRMLCVQYTHKLSHLPPQNDNCHMSRGIVWLSDGQDLGDLVSNTNYDLLTPIAQLTSSSMLGSLHCCGMGQNARYM
jgi:hypothetical protein